MTHVSTLFEAEQLHADFREGYIREQWHPTLPLRIYTYTEKAVFDRHWTSATLACRGLILDMHGNIIARPFPKFFNHGEAADPYTHIDTGDADTIFDKMDGSLGIAFHDPIAPSKARFIATRGSFTSDQAKVANRLLRDKYPNWNWHNSYTPLFEIIYPTNRIVLNYNGLEDLVLIGAMGIDSGIIYDADDAVAILEWRGPRAEQLSTVDLTRPNREGVVVYHWLSNTMEKYKQEDYLVLHKLVSNLNARTIYDAMSEGKHLDEIVAPFPDEFHEWITEVFETLSNKWIEAQTRAQVAYEAVVRYLDERYPGWGRREFASEVNQHYPGIRAELFFTLDDDRVKLQNTTWRKLRPSADWRP